MRASLPMWSLLSRRGRPRTVLLASAVLLAACEGETSATGPEDGVRNPAVGQLVTSPELNATGTDTLVYFSFSEGRLVLRSGDWDLALRRYELFLASPTLGSAKTVRAFALNNNRTATDAQVLAFTSASTLAAFEAIGTAQVPADDQFTTEVVSENQQAHLVLGANPRANDAQYWKVKLANGAFALYRTQLIRTTGFFVDSLVMETRLQTGTSLGPVRRLALVPNSLPQHVNVVNNTVVSPVGCNWDLRFNPDPRVLGLTVNAACGAGMYPGTAIPTFQAATSASDALQYPGFLSRVTSPISNSVVDRGAPFLYNLAQNERLSPTFNTFLLLSGAQLWKFQAISYYSSTGTAGVPRLRYSRLR